jgi:predicted amidohydrolase YtcJ
LSTSNTRISRRTFLKYSAAACAATYLSRSQRLAGSIEPADLVLRNGNVITVDAADDIVEAVAIRGDEIVAVGSNALVDLLVGPSTEVIDLDGKTVTPGIVDAHIHTLYYGRQFWEGFLNIRYPVVTSLDELLDAIQDRAQTTPAGQWISGNQGWAFTHGPRNFVKTDLDAVAPDHPIYLRHSSGQYSIVNSMALTAAGIDVGGITADPYGGRIVRDPVTQEPTGVLLHYPAENLVMLQADGYKDLSDEVLENDIKRAQDLLLAAGITSGQDVIVGEPAHLQIYKNLADRGELKMRMYLLLYINSEEQAQQYAEQIEGYQSDFLTFGGWKLAIDGGVAAGTTLMYDTSLPAARRAYYYYQPEVLNRMVALLHETGLQISFHIIGDKGLDEALDALEAAGAGVASRRHRIEHAIYVDPSSLTRMRDLGVVVSTQPLFISCFGDTYREATDDTAMANYMPLKSFRQMGIPLAFGCDVPASPWHDPKWAFIGATLRKTLSGYVAGADQRLNMPAVLRIHTMGSAYAAFEEDRKGSIEVGKLADLVVWNQDLYSIDDPMQAVQLRAVMTIVGGKTVAQSAPNIEYLPFLGRNR